MPSAEHLHLEEAIGAALVGVAVVLVHLLLPPTARRIFSWAAAAAAVVVVAVDFAPASVLLGVAGALAAGFIEPPVVSVPISAGALALVASRFPSGSSERLIVATVLVAAVSGAAVLVVERVSGRRSVSVLLAISAAGVYACVPDTEQIAVVAGLLAVLGAGYLVFGTRLDGPNGLMLAGTALGVLLVWAGGVGAVGRPAALAGVVACLGVLLALPVAWLLLTPLRNNRDPSVPVVILVGLQLALIYPASRLVGLEPDTQTATAGATLLLIGTTCALAVSGTIAAMARGVITSEPVHPQQ